MTDGADPRRIIEDSPMSWRQGVIVALCIALNALDGFDVLSISFASPGIASEWRINLAELGVVLSLELIGMSAGSLVLGRFADRRGRRPAILLCLTLMAVGMTLATLSQNILSLSACRLLTGFGIGGMLATTNAMVAETANRRRRNLCIALMGGGYPVGAICGGSIASMLLAHGAGWRSVFAVGAAASFLLLPLVWFLVPETIGYLTERRSRDALGRINRTLTRFGRSPIGEIVIAQPKEPALGWKGLFAPSERRTTILLTLAYLAHIMTFYFLLKWLPKLVVDMGFQPSQAGGVLVWTNIGGALGALAFSLASQRISASKLTIAAMLCSFVMICVFGQQHADLLRLGLVAAVAGFFTNAGVVGLYAITAASFPTSLRASGTGFVIGVGRGGSALAPMAAGLLLTMGIKFPEVAVILAAGSVVGAVALLGRSSKPM